MSIYFETSIFKSFAAFGTFKVNHRNGRTGRNPRTGQAIEIKPSTVPTFVAGKALKEKVNVAKN